MMHSEKFKKFIVSIATLNLIIYIVWRIFWTMPFKYGLIPIICGIAMLFAEIASAVETIMHYITSIKIMEPELPDIPDEWYPEVDVFIATHNEPLDVLYKTANGCRHLKYPDKSKVHVWFCDDGNRPSVAELAKEMGIGYQGLANNKLAKAGNLNNALSKTSGKLIATFDADMIPTRNFLLRTVPYFFLPKVKKNGAGKWVERKENEIDPNYKIGFIQTPQSFYNPDLFQYNLYSENLVPNEQDYFFKEINVSRNRSNSPIYAGSNTLISREALELVGGIATGTITEDFETGIHIQDEGYTCYATSDVYAHGLAPDDLESLIKQRERWGRGCVFSLRRINVWKDKQMSLAAKLSYFSCKLYWWSYLRRFIFMLIPMIFILFDVPAIVCEPWQMFAIWLPSYILGAIASKAVSSKIRNSRWSNIVDTVLCPYLIIPILMEALGFRKRGFHVTDKTRTVNVKSDIAYAFPHIALLALSVMAIAKASWQMIAYKTAGPAIILFWLCYNMNSLVMSIFFMLGRVNKRMSERYKADIPVKIKIEDDNVVFGRTLDISEDGFAVLFKNEIKASKNKTVKVLIETHHYEAEMMAELVYKQEMDDGYKYSFNIVELDEKNKGEYFQIVYDRDITLPSVIEDEDSIFGNIRENIIRRTQLEEI
ncbi:glycosyltransferase family 2 protein [Lachnobacterium bovis]|uniref:glycosyltransferase family 2 protein n=1 Tax=Lachnobacterium bovis TaxID=140626 RepID=UPI0012DE57CE|nr:glycosyltransferase family 2 protein [Lachnobacterium bovis]